MNIRELSQVKEKNVIYDEYIGVAYNVLKYIIVEFLLIGNGLILMVNLLRIFFLKTKNCYVKI